MKSYSLFFFKTFRKKSKTESAIPFSHGFEGHDLSKLEKYMHNVNELPERKKIWPHR